MLLVVRHGHAGDKTSWEGPDHLRPLSPAGQAEAAGLVIRLDDYPIERILSSPTVRCQQTVQPLGRDRLLAVEPAPALGVAAKLAQVLGLVEEFSDQHVVLCTHGEVIGQLLVWLVAQGLMIEQPLTWPKGSSWLLDGANGRLSLARYLAPLALADAPTPTAAPPPMRFRAPQASSSHGALDKVWRRTRPSLQGHPAPQLR